MTIDINTLNNEDIIDVRDIIARIEELDKLYEQFIGDDEGDDIRAAWDATDEGAELSQLIMLLEDLKGYGGDQQWRGDWYPVTLIRESYFTDYTEELISDCYDLKLPDFVHIDWQATAREVKVDYSEVEIDGVTYFYR